MRVRPDLARPTFPRTLSIRHAAHALGVSESTIRRLLQAGAFPEAYRIERQVVRIPVTDVRAFRLAHGIKTGPEVA